MIGLEGARPIDVDDLPQHSHWISYLLGLKPLPKSLDKSVESIAREYGEDKWGNLIKSLRSLDAPTIFDADELCLDAKDIPCYADGEILLADSFEVQAAYFELIRSELKPLIEESGHLVELGAGYGSIILKLATLPEFNRLSFTAAEFTDTGVDCIKLLTPDVQNGFETGFCDLNNLDLKMFSIPENAIYMTCWTMACLKGLSKKTLNEIILHKPSAVIHIEPIYEHWTEDSLLQMLWKRYCQMNDYNRTLLTALKGYEAEGLIKIIEEKKNVFGSNPLAPVSIVKWAPCYD